MSPVQTIEHLVRAQELATGKRRRFRRPTRQQPPLSAERAYTAELLRIVRAVARDIYDVVLPQIDTLLTIAGTRQTRDHLDQEDVSTLIDTLEGQLEVKLSNDHLRNLTTLVDGYFNDISQFSRQQTFRQIRKAIGVDALAPEPQINVMASTWRREGQRLITKMTRGQIDETMNILRRGIRAGDRPNLLAEKIRARTGIAENKAKLIARDQTNKLSGQLTKMRQTNLGIESYIWRTSLDEAVRPSHLAKEGREFRWDDPPADTGHPGEDVNCRCTAEPVIEGVSKAPMTDKAKAKLAELRKPRPKPERKPRRRVTPTVRREPRPASLPKSPFRVSANPARPADPKQGTIFDAVDNWVHGAGTKGAVALKQAAVREFGLKGAPYSRVPWNFRAEQIERARGVARGMYEQTQAQLKRDGIKKITLYRGIKENYTTVGAIESWTTDLETARKFVGPQGTIITREVPAEKLLNGYTMDHWHNGRFGQQYEWLVME